MSWNKDPVVLTVAVTGADVFRENNPNIPYTTAEIADSSIEAAAGGRHRRPPARARGRRDAERAPRAVQGRHRADPRRQRPAHDGLHRRQQRHDDRGAHDRPRGGAGHLGRRVGLDELRRRHLHHAARGRPRDRRARAPTAGIALEVEAFDVGHVVSAVRWLEEGILPPPLRINLVFGVPGGIDASPEALAAMLRPLPSGTFWTVTCIGRHHPRMLALALLHGAPGHPHRARGRRLHPPRRARRLERGAGRDGGRPRRRARPRGRHPRADPRAAGAELTRARRQRRGRRSTRPRSDLFARLGYHATSMRAIASEARRPAGGDLPLVPEQGGHPGRASG